MSEGTISETPLFRPGFSTSSPFCRIPTRRETRKIQHPRELFSPYAFAPYHFIQHGEKDLFPLPAPTNRLNLLRPAVGKIHRGKNPLSRVYFQFCISLSFSLFQLVIRNFIDIQLNCWEGREKRKFHFKEE